MQWFPDRLDLDSGVWLLTTMGCDYRLDTVTQKGMVNILIEVRLRREGTLRPASIHVRSLQLRMVGTR